MLRVILHSEEIQKHRLIAAHIIRQTADRFQNDFFKHHVANIVDFARSASEIVVGAAIKFLIGFQAFRRTAMKFRAAVRTVKQTCKQALPAATVKMRAHLVFGAADIHSEIVFLLSP